MMSDVQTALDEIIEVVRADLAVLEADGGPAAKIAALRFMLQTFCKVQAGQKSAAQEESKKLLQ